MKDFNSYKLRLEQAINEKLFFINKIDFEDYECIIDFGCGTGKLLRCVAGHLDTKDMIYVGYDRSIEMLAHAEQESDKAYHFVYTDEFEDMLYYLKTYKTLIIFSSVLHEMSIEEQRSTILRVMSKAKTVVIRDMKRPTNNEPIDRITRRRILKQVAPWQAEQFENRWGKIRDKETMYRFFLMNEFVENFDTEVEEDYFSPLWSEISWVLECCDFETVYELSYTLPYRKKQVKQRFNHTMNDITHREVIYTKK